MPLPSQKDVYTCKKVLNIKIDQSKIIQSTKNENLETKDNFEMFRFKGHCINCNLHVAMYDPETRVFTLSMVLPSSVGWKKAGREVTRNTPYFDPSFNPLKTPFQQPNFSIYHSQFQKLLLEHFICSWHKMKIFHLWEFLLNVQRRAKCRSKGISKKIKAIRTSFKGELTEADLTRNISVWALGGTCGSSSECFQNLTSFQFAILLKSAPKTHFSTNKT